MKDALQNILQHPDLKNTLFPPSSRYHEIDTATMETSDGRQVIYMRRRFVPPSGRFALIQEHTVVQGDRLDNLASQYIGDPEQYWQLCDANNAIRPEELTETVGRRLRITLPEGIPGIQNV